MITFESNPLQTGLVRTAETATMSLAGMYRSVVHWRELVWPGERCDGRVSRQLLSLELWLRLRLLLLLWNLKLWLLLKLSLRVRSRLLLLLNLRLRVPVRLSIWCAICWRWRNGVQRWWLSRGHGSVSRKQTTVLSGEGS